MFRQMKIFIPFPIEQIGYDCAKCGGACCKYGTLPLTSPEMSRVAEKQPLLKYFSSIDDNLISGISKYSKCWFLDNNEVCRIEKESGTKCKPLFCKLYPFKVVKCSGEYFIYAALMCPTMIFHAENKSNQRRKVLSYAREVIERGLVREIKASKKRYLLEKDIYRNARSHRSNTCYLDYIVKQLVLTSSRNHSSARHDLLQRINKWMHFLHIENIDFENKQLSFELNAITSILRFRALSMNARQLSYAMAALYIFMLLHHKCMDKQDESTPLYTYVSMMEIAMGLSFIYEKHDRELLRRYLSNIASLPKQLTDSFDDIADKHLPSLESRILFLRQIAFPLLDADDQMLM